MRLASRVLIAAWLLCSGTGVMADCRPVLAALDKAWAQPRLAQFDIETLDQPLSGTAFLLRIEGAIWVMDEKQPALSANPMASALRTDSASGKATCEPLGAATFRGQPAMKHRVDGSLGGSVTGRLTLWIGSGAGLPVFHEFEKLGPGGFAWVYGEAVKAPAQK